MSQVYLVPKNFIKNFDSLLNEYLKSVPISKHNEIKSHFSLKTKRNKVSKYGLRNRERMIALFDLLYYRTENFEEAWISFHTRNLLTPKRYKLFYLNFLMYHHYIEKVSNHQINVKNIGYKTIIDDIEEYRVENKIEIGYRWKYLKHAKRSMNNFVLSELDMISGLKNYIARCKFEGRDYTNDDVKKINNDNYHNIIKGDVTIERYLKPALSNLLTKTTRISRARFNGRLSTTYSNIPREIRNKLKLKSGAPISELDMSSSQWAIFMLIADKYYGGVSDIFREDIKENNFYDKIKSWHNLKSRDQAKKLSYIRGLFYEGRNYAHVPVIKNMMGSLYPIEAEILIKMKNDFYHNTHKFKKLKVYSLTQLLQTIEAIIFIDSALVYCLKNNIPAYTVHDSIIVPEKHIMEVKIVVMNAIKNLFKIDLIELRFKESIIL